MVRITWHEGHVPHELSVTQIYGLIFDNEGRILLKVEEKRGKKVFAPAGGTPESFDVDRIATLRRELLEEINVTIGDDVHLVGYQLVEGDGDRLPYAQLRMTAMIKEIGARRPDPDNGETYERVLASPERAITLLGWGEVAERQIKSAVRIAREKFSLPTCEGEDLFWV